MLIIGLISLLLAIGLGVTRSNTHYSSTIPSTLLMRITSIILIFGALLSFNALYVQAIGSGLGLYSGLFHVTSVTQAIEIFIFAVGAFILLPESVKFSGIIRTNLQSKWSENNQLNNRNRVQAEYPIIILFTTIGASFLISSSDLVSMYLSIELQSFAVYILAAINRNSESATSAGLKYFLLGALSSALILLGSSLIYAYTGLTSFEGIYMLQNTASHELGNNTEETITVASGVVIIGVGFLFKVAAAPFHSWAPDVYDGVPTIVTTWLTVMPKISIFVFLLSADLLNFEFMINQDFAEGIVESTTSGETNEVWKTLLLTTSLLSLVIGTVVGLAQYRLKRLLAYSTISHVGFLLLALCVNSEKSTQSFLFYLMQYSITNLNAFLVVLALGYISYKLPYFRTSPGNPIRLSLPERYLGRNNNLVNAKESTSSDITLISQLKGEFHTNPALSISLAICLFSMAGIPPLLGFFAKYLVLYSAIENGYYFLALIGILASVVSAVYYLRIIRVVFINTTLPERYLEKNNNALENKKSSFNGENSITNTHSYLIAVFTLFITVYILSPSLFLNSSNLLALSLFTA